MKLLFKLELARWFRNNSKLPPPTLYWIRKRRKKMRFQPKHANSAGLISAWHWWKSQDHKIGIRNLGDLCNQYQNALKNEEMTKHVRYRGINRLLTQGTAALYDWGTIPSWSRRGKAWRAGRRGWNTASCHCRSKMDGTFLRDEPSFCNGEIYNHLELRKDLEALGHRFQSQEVILAGYLEWGTAIVPKLRAICFRYLGQP